MMPPIVSGAIICIVIAMVSSMIARMHGWWFVLMLAVTSVGFIAAFLATDALIRSLL